LERLVRRETSTQQQVRRARVVLAAAGGANNEQIGREVGVTEDTARTWRRRWAGPAAALLAAAAEGDDGALAASIGGVLADAPRSGRARPVHARAALPDHGAGLRAAGRRGAPDRPVDAPRTGR